MPNHKPAARGIKVQRTVPQSRIRNHTNRVKSLFAAEKKLVDRINSNKQQIVDVQKSGTPLASIKMGVLENTNLRLNHLLERQRSKRLKAEDQLNKYLQLNKIMFTSKKA
jgi:hypothetical protein